MGDLSERKTFLDTRQAAEYLGIRPRTLEDYRFKGGGPVFIRMGLGKRSPVMYDMVDLNRWVEMRKAGSTFEE